jgi:hypothetical protein
MLRLEDMARKYSADKWYNHSYVPLYEGFLSAKPVHRLLEIGIGYRELMEPFVPFYVHGASLKMWAAWLPEAEIYACDIREDTLINEGRIHSMVCDQSSEHSLLRMVTTFGGTFDVIIDDGCHIPAVQILTARTLVPYLSPGGIYTIEDCYADTAKAIAAELHGLPLGGTTRPDDWMVVIKNLAS